MFKYLLLSLILPVVSAFFFSTSGFSEDVKQSISCQSSKEKGEEVFFTSSEVERIVSITGMDHRSICSFITLGSHVYKLPKLKEALLADKGTMKQYLNEHYLFPKNMKFFDGISDLLFSEKLGDIQQVLNVLVLSDLLYGYTVGETLPLYMELFLFYGTSNKEKEAMNKILPYIGYVEGQLLAKKDFALNNLQSYTNRVRNQVKRKSVASGVKPTSGTNKVLQDSPY